jgi:rhodanese-related sulfurtransferase
MRPRVVWLTRTRALLLALVALAAVALAGCGGSSSDTASPATTAGAAAVTLVAPEQAQKVIDAGGVTLLDVRTPEEFAAGHIAGAQNIDFYAADFADRIDALDRSSAYVVYCHSGNRSGKATEVMADKGFSDVTDVDGGIAAWESAGLPVEAGS